jgi:hypothetical protein
MPGGTRVAPGRPGRPHRFAVAVAVAIAASAAGGACAAEPGGEASCELSTPPAQAGEQVRDDLVHRIFPRRRDLPLTYTGCQLVFAPRGDGWSIAESVRFQDGKVVRSSYAATPAAPAGECLYEGGRLAAGDPRQCPSPRQLPFLSLPAGCYAEVAEQGAIPDRCKLE